MLKNAFADLLVRSKALSAFHSGAALVDGLLKRTAIKPAWERGGLIFMFHGVVEAPSPFRLDRSRAEFDEFCAVMAGSFEVLPLAEMESRRRAGTLPAGAVAITFDDGYADNHDVAWPVLKKYGLPATVFVTTGMVGGESLLWFQRLAYIFEKARPETLPVRVGPWTFTLDTEGERIATVQRISVELKTLSQSEREERIAALGEAFHITDFSELRRTMLTWEQIRAMDAGGFAVEAHTATHPILGVEPIATAAREIAESREVLSAKLGRRVDLFAYPNGKSDDMTPDVVKAVERAGFRAAFTAQFGAVSPADDPYRVPRVSAYAATASTLRLQTERFFYMTL